MKLGFLIANGSEIINKYNLFFFSDKEDGDESEESNLDSEDQVSSSSKKNSTNVSGGGFCRVEIDFCLKVIKQITIDHGSSDGNHTLNMCP